MKNNNFKVFCLVNNRLFGLGDFHVPDDHRPWPFMAQQRGAYLHFFTEAPSGYLEARLPDTSPALYGGFLTGLAFNPPGRQISPV